MLPAGYEKTCTTGAQLGPGRAARPVFAAKGKDLLYLLRLDIAVEVADPLLDLGLVPTADSPE